MPGLATVEEQNRDTRARAIGSIAKQYQCEWMRELQRRGIVPNGDYDESRVGYMAQEYKSPVRQKPTTLKDAARAFDIALANDRVRYIPVPGFDDSVIKDNARTRLPKSALAKIGRRRFS